MDSQSDKTTIKIVTQRVTSGRLLIDATKDEWTTFERGLIFYVSFTKHCPSDKNFAQICKSLLNSSLSTSGQWQEDHGDADSVLGLCKKGIPQSIILIPQASIVTKLVPGDKYLKYHSQAKKDSAEELFQCFVESLKEVCAEALAKNIGSNKKGKPQKNNSQNLKNANVLPKNAFKEGLAGEDFLAFDDATGFPTLDKDGNELTKTKRKKLEKMLQKYEEKWNKKNASSSESSSSNVENDGGQNDEAKLENSTEKLSLKDGKDDTALDERITSQPIRKTSIKFSELELENDLFVFPTFVKGTFGGRQGLEFVSSGPFTHCFNFD